MTNKERLEEIVLQNSVSNDFDEASDEWDIERYYKRPNSQCICGHCQCKYIVSIKNKFTGITLFPVGSSCIEYFANEELKEKVMNAIDMFEIYEKAISFEPLTFKDLNKRAINYFYGEDYFDTDDDYMFLKKMYLKKNKENITKKQWSKIYFVLDHCKQTLINDPFFKNEDMEKKYKDTVKNFIKSTETNKYKTKDIPGIMFAYLPEDIFENDYDDKYFVQEMFNRIKTNRKVDLITEKQTKFFMYLLCQKCIPYWKSIAN